MPSPQARAMEFDDIDWAELSRGPATDGRLDLIVLRLVDGKRSCPKRVQASVEAGLAGNRWSAEADPGREQQVTLLNSRVATALASADQARLATFGDNLLVDFDISQSNLPVAARLLIGDAEFEITAKPHTGCAKFAGRFGHEALRLVSRKDLASLRLRGVHARVMRSGVIRRGDGVTKLG